LQLVLLPLEPVDRAAEQLRPALDELLEAFRSLAAASTRFSSAG